MPSILGARPVSALLVAFACLHGQAAVAQGAPGGVCNNEMFACIKACTGSSIRQCRSDCTATQRQCTSSSQTAILNAVRPGYDIAPLSEPMSDARVTELGAVLRGRQITPGESARIAAALEQSLRLDLDRASRDPLERFSDVSSLDAKYRSIVDFCNDVRERGHMGSSSPIPAFAFRFQTAMNMAVRHASQSPEVKQAWIEGRIADGAIRMDPATRAAWAADRTTWQMQSRLRDAGLHDLFSERRTELRESVREAEQAAGFANWSEPSSVEIGLALLRVYAEVNGRVSGAYESEYAVPSAYASVDLRLVDRIIHVEKVGACTRGNGTYRCQVRVWQQIFGRGEVATLLGSSAVGNTLTASWSTAEANNGRTGPILLKATAGGWQAPELTAQLKQTYERTRAAGVADARANICTENFLRNDSFAHLTPSYCAR